MPAPKHYLVDHLPRSRSTHRNWWRHVHGALEAGGHDVDWIPASGDRVGAEGGPRIFWVFTGASFNESIAAAVRREDIVLTWQDRELWDPVSDHAFQLGYPGRLWLERFAAGGGDPDTVIEYEPFAPLEAFGWSPAPRRPRRRPALPSHDVAFFGTVWDANYDNFERLLKPLADRHSHRYRGIAYGVPRSVRRYGFARRQVSEAAGWEALLAGRVNLAIAHRDHRLTQSVTERVFLSCALGRPVVADHEGVKRYFDESEVRGFEEPGAYLEYVRWLLDNPSDAEAISRRAYERTRSSYTYRETIARVLDRLAERIGAPVGP